MPHEVWQRSDTTAHLLSRAGKSVQVPEARHESRSGLVNGTHQHSSSDTHFAAFLRSGPSNKIRPLAHNHATAATSEPSFSPRNRNNLGVRWAANTQATQIGKQDAMPALQLGDPLVPATDLETRRTPRRRLHEPLREPHKRRYPCILCAEPTKTFARPSALKTHMLTHTHEQRQCRPSSVLTQIRQFGCSALIPLHIDKRNVVREADTVPHAIISARLSKLQSAVLCALKPEAASKDPFERLGVSSDPMNKIAAR